MFPRVKITDEDVEFLDFQSPFSGDFLCFESSLLCIVSRSLPFQSPFSGDFLCFSRTGHTAKLQKCQNFQSPFSGDFLCFRVGTMGKAARSSPAFNLHFQEIFFVSSVGTVEEVMRIKLSISIFRRFSLFRKHGKN